MADNWDKLKAFLEGGARGYTGDFLDELGGAVGKLTDYPQAENALKPEGYDSSYETARDDVRRAQKELQDEYPLTEAAGTLVGTLANPVLRKAGTKGGLASKVAQNAAVGSLFGAGSADSVDNTPANMLMGAGVGAGVDLGLRGIGTGVKSALAKSPMAQKAYKLAGDKMKEAFDKYGAAHNEYLNDLQKWVTRDPPHGSPLTFGEPVVESEGAVSIPEFEKIFNPTDEASMKKLLEHEATVGSKNISNYEKNMEWLAKQMGGEEVLREAARTNPAKIPNIVKNLGLEDVPDSEKIIQSFAARKLAGQAYNQAYQNLAPSRAADELMSRNVDAAQNVGTKFTVSQWAQLKKDLGLE